MQRLTQFKIKKRNKITTQDAQNSDMIHARLRSLNFVLDCDLEGLFPEYKYIDIERLHIEESAPINPIKNLCHIVIGNTYDLKELFEQGTIYREGDKTFRKLPHTVVHTPFSKIKKNTVYLVYDLEECHKGGYDVNSFLYNNKFYEHIEEDYDIDPKNIIVGMIEAEMIVPYEKMLFVELNNAHIINNK